MNETSYQESVPQFLTNKKVFGSLLKCRKSKYKLSILYLQSIKLSNGATVEKIVH